jgi:arylsulfatase A-like enzyme
MLVTGGCLLAGTAAYFVLFRPARILGRLLSGALERTSRASFLRFLPAAVLGLALALWVVAWMARLQARAQAAQRGRNVIVIAVDTVRADRVSLLSERERSRDLTPNIRSLLAARGTVFTNAVSQAPWTLPAFASIFTGLYPEQHGAQHLDGKLSAGNLTLAELLGEAGYHTYGVVSGDYAGKAVGMDQGFQDFDESQIPAEISSEQVTDLALRFLERRHTGPFFLFAHYFDPHANYMDHPDIHFADSYAGWLRDEAQTQSQMQCVTMKRHLLGPSERTYVSDLYDEEIAYTDEHIGRLLRFLDEAQLWDSTLVVLVADHGEELLERGWIGHCVTLYDELVHVPLIIAAPPSAKTAVVERPVETRWLFPTILDFAGLSSASSRGSSRSLLADSPGGDARSSTYPVLRPGDLGTEGGKYVRLSCIVGDRWKLISDHITDRIMLFDRERDPGEVEDLSQKRPEVTARLEQSLAAWDTEVRQATSSQPSRQLDENELQQLRSLGYL